MTVDAMDTLREAICLDPVFFVRGVLGKEPWSVQAEILKSLKRYPLTAVRSCHGIGKTFTAALAILWFLYAHRRGIVLSDEGFAELDPKDDNIVHPISLPR